jgi:uncharacterized membrane protein
VTITEKLGLFCIIVITTRIFASPTEYWLAYPLSALYYLVLVLVCGLVAFLFGGRR